MSKVNPGRIVLDEKAKEAAKTMLKELGREGGFVKISPSQLISWIVVSFWEKDFAKQKGKIEKAHFNSKGYLKSMAENFNRSDDLESVLKETLKQIQPRRVKRAKNPNKEATGITDDEQRGNSEDESGRQPDSPA